MGSKGLPGGLCPRPASHPSLLSFLDCVQTSIPPQGLGTSTSFRPEPCCSLLTLSLQVGVWPAHRTAWSSPGRQAHRELHHFPSAQAASLVIVRSQSHCRTAESDLTVTLWASPPESQYPSCWPNAAHSVSL